MGPHTDQTTHLLAALRGGDATAAERLFPLVYEQLRALAAAYLRHQRSGHTLQPTALVHEAYLKLVDQPGSTGSGVFGVSGGSGWKDRAHFMAVAAMAMRQILADHARARRTARRGGDWRRVTLDEAVTGGGPAEVDPIDLDDALSALEQLDGRHARVVQMRFFGGLTMQEVAEVLGVTRTTVDNDWRVARAWLSARLSGGRD